MAKVRLTCDVAEGGTDLTKTKNATLKVTRSKRGFIEFRKGLVVEMTKEGADKWVKRGIAEHVK